jgi:hypothetical protein
VSNFKNAAGKALNVSKKMIVPVGLTAAMVLPSLSMALPSTFATDFATAETAATDGKTLAVNAVIAIALLSFGVGAVIGWIKR